MNKAATQPWCTSMPWLSADLSSSGCICAMGLPLQSLVYLNGCLKNISNDASNQKALVKLGALQVLSALLHQLATQVRSTRTQGLSNICVCICHYG